MPVDSLAIIQARMGSTRLPGKVLKKVNERTLLHHMWTRVRRAKMLTQVVIATTTALTDDAIVSVAQDLGIPVFRGSENDVLERFVECVQLHPASAIIRLTADCPLVDPLLIDRAVATFLSLSDKAFVTTSPHREELRTFPRGMDIEVFSSVSLMEAGREARSAYEREHVTPFFRLRPDRYPFHLVHAERNLSHLRLTVDDESDFLLVKRVIEHLGGLTPSASYQEICAFVEGQRKDK